MRILIPDAVFPDDHALERGTAGDIEVEIRRAEGNSELDLAALEKADAIVGYFKVKYDAGIAALAKHCRIFVRAGVGVDKVDIAAWSARGIPVCNVPDYGTTEIADHALALILALARGLAEYQQRVVTAPAAAWALAPMPMTVRRLSGARLLIVGFGAVGRSLARRALAMDMRVAIFSPMARNVPADVEATGDLDDALATADVISLHAPLKPETRHLLNRERIERLKPGALIVNTARGALIDPEALYDGLRSGPIAGAGLDVWEKEPPVDDKLFQALMRGDEWLRGRLIVTPHVAWASADAVRDMRIKAIETARDYLINGTLRNCLNPDR
jgi:lactate dehydrogenase-like 2-hydroxyacid dehydrogenase